MMGVLKFPHLEEPSARVRTLRYFMTIFCFIFLVFGFMVIICASVIVSQQPAKCRFMDQFYSGVYLLLSSGCFTSFVSFVACLQTRRSTSPLDFMSTCIVVVVILVLQIVAAICGHVFSVFAVQGRLQSAMTFAWDKYYDKDKACVDGLQERFECCGVKNYTEWLPISLDAGVTSPYPSSCQCLSSDSLCTAANETGANITQTLSLYSTPCLGVVQDDLSKTLLIPRIVGPVLTFVEFVIMLCIACFLHRVDSHSVVGAYIVRSAGVDTAARQESDSSNESKVAGHQPASTVPNTQLQVSASFSHGETIIHL